jgi:hypothetical protein
LSKRSSSQRPPPHTNEPKKVREAAELPPEFKSLNAHPLPKGGRISVHLLFEGIYGTVASSGDAKKYAPEQLEQLKVHLDGALKEMHAIEDKIRSAQRKQ